MNRYKFQLVRKGRNSDPVFYLIILAVIILLVGVECDKKSAKLVKNKINRNNNNTTLKRTPTKSTGSKMEESNGNGKILSKKGVFQSTLTDMGSKEKLMG